MKALGRHWRAMTDEEKAVYGTVNVPKDVRT